MRRFLLVAVMCGAASVAQAADMPDLPFLRGSFTEGLSATAVNWQGFYVGGQAGYGSSDMNFAGSTATMLAALLDHNVDPADAAISAMESRSRRAVDALVGGFGGFVGYNSQWDDVVVGLEVSYTHGKFGGASTRDQGTRQRLRVVRRLLPDVAVEFIGIDYDFGHGDVPCARRLRVGLLPALYVWRHSRWARPISSHARVYRTQSIRLSAPRFQTGHSHHWQH